MSGGNGKQTNKTVLVTGATGDIGRAIVLQFAREGWDIIGQYHSSPAKADALKREVKKFGVGAFFVCADFFSEKELKRFVRQLKKYTIASLVNNAGGYVRSKHFSRLTIGDLRDTFMLNTFAPIVLTAHVFNQMKKRGYGRIVNVSSIAAKYGGSAHSLHYGCSKRALEGLTKTLAREGARHNVFVNTIRPGVIDTKFHKKFSKNMNARRRLIPVQRLGTPEDVAKTVFSLASDQNDFISNDIVTVAGGE